MENEEFILGYQWSPDDGKFIGEYRFPNNKDKEEIHMPPFTTLIEPPVVSKNSAPFWNGDSWYIVENLIKHPPIENYAEIIPSYVEYLKNEGSWTDQDEIEYQNAIDRVEQERIARENSIDYLAIFRETRNALLFQSDWTRLDDVQLTELERENWRIYRQQLRDLPENIVDAKAMALDLNHSDWPLRPQ